MSDLRLRLGVRIEPDHLGVFELSPDVVTDTFAWLGIRGSGKTSGAKRLAEELCRLKLPWIALDPAGVWWGIRALENGSPSAFPVVVFGGPHGDLPLPRDKGAQIARAIVRENVCAVIDLKHESKTTWRTFLVDFCLELQQTEPAQPYHVFIEEAKNFVPQRGRTDLTQRTKEAVERLVAEGRNYGYGCSLISQRAATIDKDVLSQCEWLMALRTPGKHDRNAIIDWRDEHDLAEQPPKLGGLAAGEAYVWCPRDRLDAHVQLQPSATFHPGRTRTAWEKSGGAAQLGDVTKFVRVLQQQLAVDQAPATSGSATKRGKAAPASAQTETERRNKITDAGRGDEAAQARIIELQNELTTATMRKEKAEDECRRLAQVNHAIRKSLEAAAVVLKPLHAAYEIISGEASALLADSDAPAANTSVWAPWLTKAGGPGSMRRRMLEIMIERRQVTRTQLCTLAGASPRGGSTRNAISWLSVNKLITRDGEQVALAEVG